jgi:hypothetical protein
MVCVREGDGTATLRGPIAKQAVVRGSPKQMRDWGMPMFAVNRVESGQENVADIEQ